MNPPPARSNRRKKAALVTGGAKRIGAAVCVGLAEMGYDIALHCLNSKTDAERTARAVRDAGVRCEIFRADLSRPANAAKLVAAAAKKLGGLSVLVNNASVFEKGEFGGVTEKQLERDMAVNFKSPFFASQEFARGGREGLIVNMLDARITKNHTMHFSYNISKKCLYHFTLAAAKALGPAVRVNAVCPGPVLREESSTAADFRRMGEKTPLGTTGEAGHVRLAVEYLVNNPFVTGEALFVDGGQHI